MTRFKGYGYGIHGQDDGILGGIKDGIQDKDDGIQDQDDGIHGEDNGILGGIQDGIQDQDAGIHGQGDGIRDGILHQDDAQDVPGDGNQSAGDVQDVHGDGIGDQYAHNAQDAQDDDMESA